ncbi:alkaline phosphatase family protein [Prolixibacteraceae bacterium Z1-6]|uniref:Alkaline phosphatase family protein n=1 Tax=Draconibacterium aestuarii TaxID=2998507 RepID=A0A9X3J5U6_9BACT|nr:alkaline phosphatase family protein [Prolixibacteraceae bacterium Z1-6]
MKAGVVVIFVLFFSVFTGAVWAQKHSDQNNKSPKVVVGIVVENMRPDYIQRFWDKFQPGGFKKIYNEGAVCSNVKLTLHSQNYASGTATLFTGVHPAIHGIVDKNWYDRLRKNEIECTGDDYYMTVGADTEAGNASPKNLLSSTITDNLKILTQGKAKVFSVGLNRESAIFAAGHAADAAYWFDVNSGRMISSSFYVSTFPDWVRLFNSENYADKYSHRTWTTLLPETSYEECLRDDYILERGYFNEYNTFPHAINKYIKRTNDFRPYKTTPSANMMIKDFTLRMMENENIGDDDVTDFVTAIFSSMDYENGSFGPASLEMMDSYLYLDQYIGELISSVEKKYGKENVLFFLTANTSASYPVEYLKDEFNLSIDYFNVESAIALLTSYLNITYGEKEWIEHYSDLQLYLDHTIIEKSDNVTLNELRDVTSNFINQFEGVQVSMPAYQLEQGSSANGMLEPIYKTYFKNRSGDLLFNLKEGWQPGYKFKRVNYTDQSRIPLVFFGNNIKAQTISGRHNAADLVPTLSEMLQIPVPDKCQGKIIEELLTN